MSPPPASHAARSGWTFLLRFVGVYLAVSVGGFIGGLVFFLNADLPPVDNPAAFQPAMLVVNGIHALMLAALASRFAVSTIRSALVLFAVFFGVQGLLTGMENPLLHRERQPRP